jgi:restriction system protein
MSELFDKHGGFRRLHSFTLATIVQLETLRFCRRFITQDPRDSGAKFYDPKGRQYDQMTAAQSGPGSGHGASEQDSFWCPAANGVDPCLGITPSIPARFHAE